MVTVPPLRERPDDVELLANAFGQSFAGELGIVLDAFSESALATLGAHHWPGNVRELKNAVERSVARAAEAGETIIEHIVVDPFESRYRPPVRGEEAVKSPQGKAPDPEPAPLPTDLKAALADYERIQIQRALAAHRHHQGRTADALGLSYSQLRNSMKRLGLTGGAN